MKRVYITFITISTLVCLSILTATAKDVRWLHGFNSNSMFWQRYCQELTSGYGVCDGYKSDTTITVIGNTLNDSLCYRYLRNPIIIGHSMGGLVARQIQKQNSNVSAVITVGTPNQGLPAIEVIKDGGLDRLLNSTLKRINSDIDNILLAPRVITRGFVDFEMMLGLSNLEGQLRDAMSQFDAYKNDTNCVRDMLPKSHFLSSLSPTCNGIPILTIAGEEETWQTMRLASSTKFINSIVSMNNTTNDGFDMEYVKKLHDMINIIVISKISIISLYTALNFIGFATINPALIAESQLLLPAVASLGSLNRLLETDIHNDLNSTIIRSTRTEYHSMTYTVSSTYPNNLVWVDHLSKQSYEVDLGPLDPQPQTYEATVGWTTHINEGNDGMIPVSYTHLKDNAPNIFKETVQKANHMEMSGHKGVRDVLEAALKNEKAFGGNFYYDK